MFVLLTFLGNITQGTVNLSRFRLRIAQVRKITSRILFIHFFKETKSQGDLFWWYFIAIKNDEDVVATDFVAGTLLCIAIITVFLKYNLVLKPEIEKMVEPTIEFKEEFKFENLKSDFLLSVEVFGFHAISNAVDSIPKTPKQSKKLGIFQSIRHNLTPKVEY